MISAGSTRPVPMSLMGSREATGARGPQSARRFKAWLFSVTMVSRVAEVTVMEAMVFRKRGR